MTENKPHVRVGIGIVYIRDGKILLGKRKNAHGSGAWSPAGGHLEFGETPRECALRELNEETGLVAQDAHFVGWVNDVFAIENKHYVTLFMLAHNVTGEVTLCEPEKCEGWEWFTMDSLPSPLFAPMATFLQQYPGTLQGF